MSYFHTADAFCTRMFDFNFFDSIRASEDEFASTWTNEVVHIKSDVISIIVSSFHLLDIFVNELKTS